MYSKQNDETEISHECNGAHCDVMVKVLLQMRKL